MRRDPIRAPVAKKKVLNRLVHQPKPLLCLHVRSSSSRQQTFNFCWQVVSVFRQEVVYSSIISNKYEVVCTAYYLFLVFIAMHAMVSD